MKKNFKLIISIVLLLIVSIAGNAQQKSGVNKYAAGMTYNVGDLVVYNGIIYKASVQTSNIPTTADWNENFITTDTPQTITGAKYFGGTATFNASETFFSNATPKLYVHDTNSTGVGQFGTLEFVDNTPTAKASIGFDNVGNTNFNIVNTYDLVNGVTINQNPIYHAGNFTDYMNKTTAENIAGAKTFTNDLLVSAYFDAFNGASIGDDLTVYRKNNANAILRVNTNTAETSYFIQKSGSTYVQSEYNDATGFLFKSNAFNIFSVDLTGKTTFSNKLVVDARISQTGLGGSTFVGFEAGLNDDLTANNNTAFGSEAMKSMSTGIGNVATGHQALWSNNGSNNVANGTWAMKNNTGGSYNVAVGFYALYSASLAYYNTAVGSSSLSVNSTGYGNTSIGYKASCLNTEGYHNSSLGFESLQSNRTGIRNVGLGYRAGRYITNASAENYTTNNSIFIGADTRALADNETNQIVIGHTTTGNGSNTVTIGNSSITDNYFSGNVGLSTSILTNIAGSISTLTIGGANPNVSGGISYQMNGVNKFYGYVDNDNLFSHQALTGIGQKFITDNTVRYVIDSSGNHDFKTGTALFGGAVTAPSYKVTALNTAPATSTSTGTVGEIRYTADYIYICVATDTWKRSALNAY